MCYLSLFCTSRTLHTLSNTVSNSIASFVLDFTWYHTSTNIMISISSVVVLLPLIMSFAAGGSFYHLLNAKEDTEKSSTAGTLFFSKKFFECDREENCTHVANLIETDSLVMVYGEHEMKKLPINAFVWAKIKEVCKAPKIITKGMNKLAV